MTTASQHIKHTLDYMRDKRLKANQLTRGTYYFNNLPSLVMIYMNKCAIMLFQFRPKYSELTILELILLILNMALGAWLLISPLVYIYWHFNRDARHQHEEHVHAVLLGTLITLTLMIGAVLTQLLVYIPESWGWLNHDAVFVRMRGYMAFTLGLLAAIHLMQSMSKKEAVEDKKRALCHELEVNQRTNELNYLNFLKPCKGKDESNGLQGEWAESMTGSPVRLRSIDDKLNVLPNGLVGLV
jgi:hypothetical protein